MIGFVLHIIMKSVISSNSKMTWSDSKRYLERECLQKMKEVIGRAGQSSVNGTKVFEN